MPQNKLTDLNNHLFAALERLDDDNLSDEQLKREIDRAKAVASLATQVVASANVSLDAAQFLKSVGYNAGGESVVLGITGRAEGDGKQT